jgi:mitochondrial inner membrane protease ATP23
MSSSTEKDRCDKYVSSGLQGNTTIQFLLEKLENMGCRPPPGFISCQDCGEKAAGGGFGMLEEIILDKKNVNQGTAQQCHRSFSDLANQLKDEKEGRTKLRLLPEIFICQNYVQGENHVHHTMIHELIHAIDMCRTKMDPLHNCIHLACTEIRAENLSGECNFWNEISRGQVQNYLLHGQKCVKRRAILSVKANPNCTDNAERYVDAAFENCFADTFPFDRHPNQR